MASCERIVIVNSKENNRVLRCQTSVDFETRQDRHHRNAIVYYDQIATKQNYVSCVENIQIIQIFWPQQNVTAIAGVQTSRQDHHSTHYMFHLTHLINDGIPNMVSVT